MKISDSNICSGKGTRIRNFKTQKPLIKLIKRKSFPCVEIYWLSIK